MSYMSGGSLTNLEALSELHAPLCKAAAGLAYAGCTMPFLPHALALRRTTCLTIKNRDAKPEKDAVSFALPTLTGIIVLYGRGRPCPCVGLV